MRSVLLVLSLLLPQFAIAQELPFASVQLPRGIRIAIPTGWLLIGASLRPPIQTPLEQAMDLSSVLLPGGKNINIIGAKSLPETTYAAVRVDSTVPPLRAPTEVVEMTPKGLEELQQKYRKTIAQEVLKQGLQLLELYPLRRDRISAYPAIVVEYRRSGLDGPVMVQINQIFTPTQEIRVALSYREAEKAKWKPVLLGIRNSIQIIKWP